MSEGELAVRRDPWVPDELLDLYRLKQDVISQVALRIATYRMIRNPDGSFTPETRDPWEGLEELRECVRSIDEQTAQWYIEKRAELARKSGRLTTHE